MRAALSRWLPAGSFARNVGMLTGGTAFAQGLAVLALPLLTRLYSPEDFDLLAVYVAIIGIATVASCLRYNIAIPLPENDADGMTLLAVALISAIAVSAALALPVLLAPAYTAAVLGQPRLEPYLWMVPFGVLLASAYNALQYWSSRKKQFGLVARTRMTRAGGGIGTQAAIGAAAPSPFGLIFGHMLYGGLGVVGLLHNLLLRDRLVLRQQNFTRIREQLIAYRRFPIWSAPEALFNTLGMQLPVILIAAASAGPEAGFLMLAMRVMGLPMTLVGASVSQVLIAEAPAKLRNGTLATFTRSTMWRLFLIGAPPLLVVGALSPLLFPVVFGPEWGRAGWLMSWMAPWFLLQFVASPVSMVLLITGHYKQALLLQAAGFVLRVGGVILASNVAVERVSETYALTGVLFYGFYIVVIYVTQIKGKNNAPVEG